MKPYFHKFRESHRRRIVLHIDLDWAMSRALHVELRVFGVILEFMLVRE